MKVLHFYKTYYPDSFGGIEQVIYQLIVIYPAWGRFNGAGPESNP
jgi:rhamnosyl/mannosyltransferase